jgi:hypothetical protein
MAESLAVTSSVADCRWQAIRPVSVQILPIRTLLGTEAENVHKNRVKL